MSDLKDADTNVIKHKQAPRIRYSAGFTANTGNFESIRFDVSIEDSAKDGEKISEASARVYGMVEHELLARYEQTRKDIAEIDKKAKKK